MTDQSPMHRIHMRYAAHEHYRDLLARIEDYPEQMQSRVARVIEDAQAQLDREIEHVQFFGAWLND